MEKNRKSLDDDDERGNLSWSFFSCSSPLHLALLALASLALALLALIPLAFAPLPLSQLAFVPLNLARSPLPRSPL